MPSVHVMRCTIPESPHPQFPLKKKQGRVQILEALTSPPLISNSLTSRGLRQESQCTKKKPHRESSTVSVPIKKKKKTWILDNNTVETANNSRTRNKIRQDLLKAYGWRLTRPTNSRCAYHHSDLIASTLEYKKRQIFSLQNQSYVFLICYSFTVPLKTVFLLSFLSVSFLCCIHMQVFHPCLPSKPLDGCLQL